ncbi:MAG: hypothetical protein V1886_02335 [archaeon]
MEGIEKALENNEPGRLERFLNTAVWDCNGIILAGLVNFGIIIGMSGAEAIGSALHFNSDYLPIGIAAASAAEFYILKNAAKKMIKSSYAKNSDAAA